LLNQLLHWLKEKQPFFLKGLLAFLFVDVMVDPNNLIFHAKYVLFALVFVVWLPGILSKKLIVPKQLWYAVIFISLFMPFYALSMGLINSFLHNTPVGNLVYFNSFFFFLIVLVIANEKIDLTWLFNNSSLLIVLMTLSFYLILIFNSHLFGSLYQYFVADKGVAVYALRNYGEVTLLMIFYKTSPLLVFPLSYYLFQILIDKQRKAPFVHYLLVVLIAITLFLSGTRANLLSLVLIIIFYLGFYVYRKSKLWFVLLGSLGLLIALFTMPSIAGLLLNQHEASNVIKFGYLSSYADFFNQHILSLIFGQGIGGSFYASVLQRFTNVSELTYFELIRIWGVPISIVFAGTLIWPLLAEIKAKRLSHLFIAYVAYLFIAGTNPLLLSSTGMLVLVYVFSISMGSNRILKTG